MLKTSYLIRLDDACPYMDAMKWQRIENILERYGIKPLVGVIPANADPKTMIEDENQQFWENASRWVEKGWEIALHGYNHLFKTNVPGINPFWNRSEYAGLSLDEQRTLIKKGVEELEKHNIYPHYFFAPGHTFDNNTIIALRECSSIRKISDTIAFRPYKKDDFVFIPQIVGHCVKMPIPGVYTFCFHPNIMKEKDFIKLEMFLDKYNELFISFSSIKIDKLKSKSLFDKTLSLLFFLYRDIRGLRRKDDLKRMKEKSNNPIKCEE